MPELDRSLLGIMVCPIARVPLIEHDGWLYSTDRLTRRMYPIRGGIPVMLVEESVVATEEKFDEVMNTAGVQTALRT